jgi:hypothetical protein
MPQLWLTFEEIADLFYCDAAGARRRVIANQWERRRYSDGLTRAQLPPEVAHEFMLRYARKHESRGATVDEFDAARRVFSQAEMECTDDVLLKPDVTSLKRTVIGSPPPWDARSAQRSRQSAEVQGEVICEQLSLRALRRHERTPPPAEALPDTLSSSLRSAASAHR